MKQPLVFLENKERGFTLLEFIVAAGILAIILIVIILFMKKGMDFWVKGLPTKPQEIIQLILEGEEGRTEFEKMGLISTIRGGYSIYRPEFGANPQFDNETQLITLGTNSIMIGYGIVDSKNAICDSTVTVTTDVAIIYQGSATTTDFRKGTQTLTVISPYNVNEPMGTTSLLLATNPLGDDYGLAIGYQFSRSYNQGTVTKSIFYKNSAGTWELATRTVISKNVSQLEFRYFTADEELPAGTPTVLSKIRQIEMVMITLKVDNDDDKDGSIEEDPIDGIDNDSDGKIDEDYFNGMSVTTRVYFRNLGRE